MTDNKPLPKIARCPFCQNDEANMWDNEDSPTGPIYYIHCDACGGEGPPEHTELDAITVWNHVSSCVWFFERLVVALSPDDPPERRCRMNDDNKPLQERIFDAIRCERQQQDAKWGEQNHAMMHWTPILGEEFGEVCKAILESHFRQPDPIQIEIELIQTAAVCVAMVECLKRNGL